MKAVLGVFLGVFRGVSKVVWLHIFGFIDMNNPKSGGGNLRLYLNGVAKGVGIIRFVVVWLVLFYHSTACQHSRIAVCALYRDDKTLQFAVCS